MSKLKTASNSSCYSIFLLLHTSVDFLGHTKPIFFK